MRATGRREKTIFKENTAEEERNQFRNEITFYKPDELHT